MQITKNLEGGTEKDREDSYSSATRNIVTQCSILLRHITIIENGEQNRTSDWRKQDNKADGLSSSNLY